MGPILGALFAVLIGLLAVRPVISYQEAALHNVQSAATAGQMRQIATAAQAYIQANYAAVEANSTAGSPATITVPMLESTGYLSPSTSPTNPFGQTWVVQVLQPSPGQLQALVLSTGGATIPEKQAPAIATQTGQEGGFVPYNGQYGSLSAAAAQGAYGHWSVALNGYTNPGPGHLAALLAFNNGNLENDYLYRVAVPGQPQLNTMQTALNMGNNDVNNANNIQANGRIGAAGQSATSGYPAGWGGGVHTWDLYANGSVGAGTNGSLLADLTGNGGTQGQVQTVSPNGGVSTSSLSNNTQAFIGADNSSGAYVSINVPDDGSNNNASIATNGAMYVNKPGGGQSFYAYNNGYAGVTDTFTVGSRLELGTAFGGANQGGGCNPNGEIAANANGSGQLMACVNGTWQAAGGTGFTQSYQMGVGNGTWYQNTGSGPMFLASNCNSTPYSSGYVENVTIIVRNQAGQQISSSNGQIQEGGSDANFAGIPSASAIVPAGDYFDVVGSNMSCSLMVTR
ncbi:shufflon system plasmid conjugative transfer pilus tip adhesin PilV [Acidocella sp.]|uniref:shufflon system plasmid conjugative transfer pilus tip adhesin PilV n=1 Tax=Acidocella sp. TaxID=50710 RepID=UPI003D08DD69